MENDARDRKKEKKMLERVNSVVAFLGQLFYSFFFILLLSFFFPDGDIDTSKGGGGGGGGWCDEKIKDTVVGVKNSFPPLSVYLLPVDLMCYALVVFS